MGAEKEMQGLKWEYAMDLRDTKRFLDKTERDASPFKDAMVASSGRSISILSVPGGARTST